MQPTGGMDRALPDLSPNTKQDSLTNTHPPTHTPSDNLPESWRRRRGGVEKFPQLVGQRRAHPLPAVSQEHCEQLPVGRRGLKQASFFRVAPGTYLPPRIPPRVQDTTTPRGEGFWAAHKYGIKNMMHNFQIFLRRLKCGLNDFRKFRGLKCWKGASKSRLVKYRSRNGRVAASTGGTAPHVVPTQNPKHLCVSISHRVFF